MPGRDIALPCCVDVLCSIWDASLRSMPQPNWITDEVMWLEQMVLGSLATTEASCKRPKIDLKGQKCQRWQSPWCEQLHGKCPCKLLKVAHLWTFHKSSHNNGTHDHTTEWRNQKQISKEVVEVWGLGLPLAAILWVATARQSKCGKCCVELWYWDKQFTYSILWWENKAITKTEINSHWLFI